MISKTEFINWVVGIPNNQALIVDTFGQLGYIPVDVNFKEDYKLVCTKVEYNIQFYDGTINQSLPSTGYVPKLAETYYSKYFHLELKTLQEKFNEILSDEIVYLKENDFFQNEHGVFLYVSDNGNYMLSLDFVLNDYKEWLIENNKVKEL